MITLIQCNQEPRKNLKCEPCDKTFTEFKYYQTHFVRTHKTLPPCYEGRESFKCEIESCGYIFLRKYRLDEHMKAVHGDKNKTNASRKVRNNKTFASKPGSIHCPECNRPMSSDHKLKR